MILFGGPSFCLFSFYVYVVIPIVVPVHLQVVDSPVVGFLVANLQLSVELLVDFLG